MPNLLPRFSDWKKEKKKLNESKTNGSFLSFCRAYGVNATQADYDELGDDVSREKFKEYFGIPADADENPSYKAFNNFDPKLLNKIKLKESSTDDKTLSTVIKLIRQNTGQKFDKLGKVIHKDDLSDMLEKSDITIDAATAALRKKGWVIDESASNINESSDEFEILVTFATKDVIEDDFEDGEIGGGQTHDLPHAETIYKDFASICSTLGLSDDISKWYCVDDRIIHSRMEDADNNEILPTDGSYELWKSKKMKLYSVDYDLSIKFIPKTSPTEDDIEKNLGIKPS